MNEKTTIAVLLVIISIVASVGNGLVVFVILKKREWLKKVHSCLLLALAVQDILTAIGLLVLPGFVQSSKVYELPQSDMLGQIFCSLIWSRYVPFALAITSVYTCLMLALDRWVAVFRPMSYKQFSVSGKVIAVMVVVPWLAGFGFEVNTALHVDCRKESDGTRVCKWSNINSSAKNSCVAILTFLGKFQTDFSKATDQCRGARTENYSVGKREGCFFTGFSISRSPAGCSKLS